jgi:hypothetical protein
VCVRKDEVTHALPDSYRPCPGARLELARLRVEIKCALLRLSRTACRYFMNMLGLPDELLCAILFFIEPKTLVRSVGNVCQRFYALSRDSCLWRHIWSRDIPAIPFDITTDWVTGYRFYMQQRRCPIVLMEHLNFLVDEVAISNGMPWNKFRKLMLDVMTKHRPRKSDVVQVGIGFVVLRHHRQVLDLEERLRNKKRACNWRREYQVIYRDPVVFRPGEGETFGDVAPRQRFHYIVLYV